MKALHFSARTREELRRQSVDAFGSAEGNETMDAFERHFVDGKRRDAQVLVSRLAHASGRLPSPRWDDFHATRHWCMQFVRELADVPPLR